MGSNRFIYSVAAVFVAACGCDFLLHNFAFAELYLQTANLWRNPSDMQPLAMCVSQLLFSIFFVWIFTLNYANKGNAEGLRYGMYSGLLIASIELGTYTYLPIPFTLTLSWMGAALLKCIICGIVSAIVYRNK